MKANWLTALLVVGVSLQVVAMGHPHNIFAARKHIKAKRTALGQTLPTDSSLATYTKNTVLTTTSIWVWLNHKQTK